MSGDTRRASRAARDIIIFAVTTIACAVGACVGIVAVNLTGANDEPRQASISGEEVRALTEALDQIRPADLAPEQRQTVDDARDLLQSIEAGDTVVITPPPATTTPTPTATTAPPATAPPQAQPDEIHDDHRTGPLVTLYPPTTEAEP